MGKLKKVYALIIIFCLTAPVISYAEKGGFVPFVSVRQEYSDNINFSSIEEEDFITTAAAGADYIVDTEQVYSRLNGRIWHLFYQDNDQLDTTNGSVSFRWDYQYSERSGIGVDADYRKDSQRDRDTDTTGLVLSGDRKKADAAVSASHMFSEITRGEITVSGGFTDREETSDEEENKNAGVSMVFTKNLSERFKNTTGLFNLSYVHYESDLETTYPGTTTAIYFRDFTSDIIQAYTGFSKDITELYSFYMQAGVSWTDTTEGQRTLLRTGGATISDTRAADQDSSTFGGVFLSGLNYDGLYYDVSLSLSHDVRGSTGTNGVVERSAVSFSLDRKVSDSFFITFDASCYLNKNERETLSDLEELTINIQPGLRYRFMDSFTLTCGYRYTSNEDRLNNTTNERNLVYFELKKEFGL